MSADKRPAHFVPVLVAKKPFARLADEYAAKYGFQRHDKTAEAITYLSLNQQGLHLHHLHFNPLRVDFVSAPSAMRRTREAGVKQDIAKALGLHRQRLKTILDVTAGWGRDAFVLASLGAQVSMLERSPIMAALLEDGLRRLTETMPQPHIALSLQWTDAIEYLSHLQDDACPDAIYFDPMHPKRGNSALVKKDLQTLQAIIGNDPDQKRLFDLCCQKAKQRVVVKWPRKIPFDLGRSPDMQYLGKTIRFDVYLTRSGD